MTRFLRPEGNGRWGVYTDGTESWYRKGTVRQEADGFRIDPRDCGFIKGPFATLREAGEAMVEEMQRESRAIQAQVTYERANGWSTD